MKGMKEKNLYAFKIAYIHFFIVFLTIFFVSKSGILNLYGYYFLKFFKKIKKQSQLLC